MNPLRPSRPPLRIALVALLLIGAVAAALPWFVCSWNPMKNLLDPDSMLFCTFGLANDVARYGVPGFNGPYWGSILVGLMLLAASVFAAFTRRSL